MNNSLIFFIKRLLIFAFAMTANSSFATTKTLVLLGDSLTEGLGVPATAAYPALLESRIKAQGKSWTIVNSGISGSTTASAPSRMKWILKNTPDLILLELGANDGLRGIDINVSKKNLESAIDMALSKKVVIVLIGVYLPPNYGKKYSEDFKKMYSDVAKRKNIRLIPFLLDKVAGNPQLNLPDGIHPNEKGHKIITETIYSQIKDLL